MVVPLVVQKYSGLKIIQINCKKVIALYIFSVIIGAGNNYLKNRRTEKWIW